MSPWEARSCPSLIALSMARIEEIGCFASKDTSGRSFEPHGHAPHHAACLTIEALKVTLIGSDDIP